MFRSGLRPLLPGLLLWFAIVVPAQVQKPWDRVAGEVVDAKSGRPVAHAQVSLAEIRSNRDLGTVITTEDGTFRFPDPIAPGKYRLEASASGYLPAAYLQHGQLSTAIVTGAGVATDALRLTLTPAATIGGHVVDERGDPVPHATVSLFRQGTEADATATHLVNTRPVDDDGGFEFYPVLPGRYYLAARGVPWYAVHPPQQSPGVQQIYRASVDPALDVAYPTIFYPAALREEAASPLDVEPGDQITADTQMVPQHALTLTLPREGPNGPPAQLFQTLFGSQQPVQAEISMSEHGETITGLPPGRYTIRAYTGGANRMPFPAGTVELTDSPVVHETSPPPALSSLSVSVRTSGPDPLPERTMVTLVSPEPGSSVSSPANEKGEAEFAGVPPGNYRLRIAGNRRPNLPIGSLSVEGKAAPDLRVQVPGGGHLAATAILSGPPVTVEGSAVRDGKPAAASLILLVPAGANTDPELFRRDQSDLDGTFSLSAVAPGKYLLVALDDAWSLPWTDLGALTPYLLHAQPLLIPSGSAGTVHLPTPVPTQARR